jgi:hypothetical protein
MKMIKIVIFAGVMLLLSCKKESVLEKCKSKTEYKLLEIEVNNEFHESDIGIYIYKNNVLCSQKEMIKLGDEIMIRVFNNYRINQNVEILLTVDGNFIKGSEKDLIPEESIAIYYTYF